MSPRQRGFCPKFGGTPAAWGTVLVPCPVVSRRRQFVRSRAAMLLVCFDSPGEEEPSGVGREGLHHEARQRRSRCSERALCQGTWSTRSPAPLHGTWNLVDPRAVAGVVDLPETLTHAQRRRRHAVEAKSGQARSARSVETPTYRPERGLPQRVMTQSSSANGDNVSSSCYGPRLVFCLSQLAGSLLAVLPPSATPWIAFAPIGGAQCCGSGWCCGVATLTVISTRRLPSDDLAAAAWILTVPTVCPTAPNVDKETGDEAHRRFGATNGVSVGVEDLRGLLGRRVGPGGRGGTGGMHIRVQSSTELERHHLPEFCSEGLS